MARGVEIRTTGADRCAPGLICYEVVVPPRGEWSACVEVGPVIDGEVVAPKYRCGQPVERATPTERMAAWRRQVPQVDTDHPGLKQVVARSAEDLGRAAHLRPRLSPSGSWWPPGPRGS